jgi:hypothetical protein
MSTERMMIGKVVMARELSLRTLEKRAWTVVNGFSGSGGCFGDILSSVRTGREER